jgi:hypothetical protein
MVNKRMSGSSTEAVNESKVKTILTVPGTNNMYQYPAIAQFSAESDANPPKKAEVTQDDENMLTSSDSLDTYLTESFPAVQQIGCESTVRSHQLRPILVSDTAC